MDNGSSSDSSERWSLYVVIAVCSLAGAGLTLLGCRNYRQNTTLVCLLAVGFLVKYCMQLYIPTYDYVYWIVSVGVGLLVGLFTSIFSTRLCILILSATGGFALAAVLLSLPLSDDFVELSTEPQLLYSLTASSAAFFMILSIFAPRGVTILSTAIAGSLLVFVAIDYIVNTYVMLSVAVVLANFVNSNVIMGVPRGVWQPYASWGRTSESDGLAMMGGMAGLVVLSVLFQLCTTRNFRFPFQVMQTIVIISDENEALIQPGNQDDIMRYDGGHDGQYMYRPLPLQERQADPLLTSWGAEPIGQQSNTDTYHSSGRVWGKIPVEDPPPYQ